jgi:hypothetical protein
MKYRLRLLNGQFAVRAMMQTTRTAIAAAKDGFTTGKDLETALWTNHRMPKTAAIAIEINVGK